MESNSTLQKTTYFSKNVTFVLKGVAVMLMLFYHLFYCSQTFVEMYGVSSFPISERLMLGLSSFGKICVSVFVLLTAYGITVSLNRRNNVVNNKDMLNRFKKLEINFLFVYILSIMTCFLREDNLQLYLKNGKLLTPIYIVFDSLGLASFFGTPTYNDTWWYMKVAILLIFSVPVFIKLYDMFGISTLVIAAMLPMWGIDSTSFTTYIFSAFVGVYLAKSNIFSLIEEKSKIKKNLILISCSTIFLLLVFLFLRLSLEYKYSYWLDPIVTSLFAVLLFIIIDILHIKLRILTFIGKYSMNIFLVHTLIYEYYFTDFIYSFNNWVIITLVLIVTSLLCSVAIEFLKKLTFKLINYLKIRLTSKMQTV